MGGLIEGADTDDLAIGNGSEVEGSLVFIAGQDALRDRPAGPQNAVSKRICLFRSDFFDLDLRIEVQLVPGLTLRLRGSSYYRQNYGIQTPREKENQVEHLPTGSPKARSYAI